MEALWKTTPADLALSPDRVDIWRTRIELSDAAVEEYFALLSRHERDRANRFTFPGKRREYIVTRGLLRHRLGRLLATAPESIKLEYGDRGKPCYAGKWREHAINFNVSHSHGMGLIAITLDREIGVDVEKIRLQVDFEKLAERYFSPGEALALRAVAPEQRAAAFYACWTRKEAFVKALGKGIAFGLAEFSVSIDPGEPHPSLTTHWDRHAAEEWSLLSLDVDSEYLAALAVAGNGVEVRCWE